MVILYFAFGRKGILDNDKSYGGPCISERDGPELVISITDFFFFFFFFSGRKKS